MGHASSGRLWTCAAWTPGGRCSAGGGCVVSALRLAGAVGAAMLLAAACTIASLCVGFRTVAAVRRARRRVYGFRRAVVPPVSVCACRLVLAVGMVLGWRVRLCIQAAVGRGGRAGRVRLPFCLRFVGSC